MLNLARHDAGRHERADRLHHVAVYPRDVMQAIGRGINVVPRHLAAEVAADAAVQKQLEEFVSEEVRDGAAVASDGAGRRVLDRRPVFRVCACRVSALPM